MSAHPCRVLVVEDDGPLRGMLADTLWYEGFDVRAVGDGFAALELVQAWAPDLILLDLDLPAMNGLAFRSHQLGIAGAEAIPVVVLSGHDGLRARVGMLGVEAILKKPCDLDLVIGSLRHLSEQQHPGPDSAGPAPL